ncbi:hypothetical protein V5O48_001864 [Marasmius crinis-equi]|uniref:Uncharacterized protein n=1 Tax=Marasmius crinis-equi TaxID=585013 RepID=A0ABR3FXT1_9AGAR
MNFVGATHAVSLYPYSSLHLFEAIRLVSTEKGSRAWKKYKKRGWIFRGSGSALAGLRRASEFGPDRAVGDSATWILALHGLGLPHDPRSLHLKWLLAHSWSHIVGTQGTMRTLLHLGGRCTWLRVLTFSAASLHLRLHEAPVPEQCDLCEEDDVAFENIYEMVHQSIKASPRVNDTGIDRFTADYLRAVFDNLPPFDPDDPYVLPDAYVSLYTFVQIKSLLMYSRVEPKVGIY